MRSNASVLLAQRRHLALPAAATALSLLLGGLFLGSKSFWLDESFSAAAARLGVHDLFHLAVDSQANMSFYYLFLHGWRVVGDGETALRSLSVLFAAAAVPVTWAVARRLFDPLVAAVTAFLLAGNQFLIQYAQEARSYSLAVLLASLSSLMFLRAAERPIPSRLTLYALVGGVALYVHLYTSLVLLAQLCATILVPHRRKLVPAFIGVGLLGIPMALFVMFRDSGQIGYLQPPGAIDLVKTLAHLGGGRTTFLLLMFLATFGLVRHRRAILTPRSVEGWPWAFALLWLGLPVAISLVGSQAKPFFQPFYLIVCLPPALMLVALGLVSLPRRRLRLAAGTIVVALSLVELFLWYGFYEKENWRDAQHYVATEARPGDVIAFDAPYARVPFEYYELRNETSGLQPGYPNAPWGTLSLLHATLGQDSAASVTPLLVHDSRVWFVLSHEDPATRKHVLSAARTADRLISARDFKGVDVYLLGRER